LYCKIPDIFGRWRNLGSILFVLQNSQHFWTVEEFRIYFVCTAKFPTFLDGGGIQDLFGCPGLSWAGLGWPGLAWAGLAWAGLAWAGLGWPAKYCITFS
jgi:hypothetical protein